MRGVPAEQTRSLARGAAVATFLLASCSPCNDGLHHTDWEARERIRTAAALPWARQRLTAALDSAWSDARPRDLTDQFRSLPEQAFSLGGAYNIGGHPLYGRSCSNPDAFPSQFRLRQVYAGITADSLVVLSGEALAIDTTNPSASKMRPFVERQVLSLREITGAWLNVVVDPPRDPLVVTTTVGITNGAPVASRPPDDTLPRAFLVLRCATTSASCYPTIPVALEDSGGGRAFAAHLLAAARRLQRNNDPTGRR